MNTNNIKNCLIINNLISLFLYSNIRNSKVAPLNFLIKLHPVEQLVALKLF